MIERRPTGDVSVFPDIYTIYSNDESKVLLLQQAEYALRSALKSETAAAVFDDFFNSLSEEDASFLTSRSGDLRDLTPMNALRLKIESDEKQEIEGAADISEESSKSSGGRIPISDPVSPNYRFRNIRYHDDIGSLGNLTEVVHLTKQDVTSYAALKKIIANAPNLRVIQAPPSIFDNLIVSSPRKIELLDKHGIRVDARRIRDNAFYDETPMDDDYIAKKRLYDKMTMDPINLHFFEEMTRFEFLEAEIALAYLGGERRPIRDIASDLGISIAKATRRLQVFLHWLGYESQNERISIGAELIPSRVDRYLAAEQIEAEREKLSSQLSVAGVEPPSEIPVSRWDMWNKIMTMRIKHPEKLEEIRHNYPRKYQAFMSYFHVNREGGDYRTQKEVGSGFGVSREMARIWKNQVLEELGLLDD